MDEQKWLEYRSVLDRHEKDIIEIKESVKASISTITSRLTDQGEKLDHQSSRLDEIESSNMDQAQKIDRLVNETAGQSVLLENIKENLCTHKDQQEDQLKKQGAQLESLILTKDQNAGKIETLSKFVHGEDLEKPGGIAGDLALVKQAVVHGPAQIGAMRIYRTAAFIAMISFCGILYIYPELVPVVIRALERYSTGGTH